MSTSSLSLSLSPFLAKRQYGIHATNIPPTISRFESSNRLPPRRPSPISRSADLGTLVEGSIYFLLRSANDFLRAVEGPPKSSARPPPSEPGLGSRHMTPTPITPTTVSTMKTTMHTTTTSTTSTITTTTTTTPSSSSPTHTHLIFRNPGSRPNSRRLTPSSPLPRV
ncbi:hypothetical protein E2C01_017625 [Portunus trituberculatus]|uniref:Uncharacterized protein n=1 Tax=Portunus trituberculatus TaxID=210409 RepID=A0A5B7DS91_PORTR|nr:hypothetical protein [Portunus trituberculatus]